MFVNGFDCVTVIVSLFTEHHSRYGWWFTEGE